LGVIKGEGSDLVGMKVFELVGLKVGIMSMQVGMGVKKVEVVGVEEGVVVGGSSNLQDDS